MLWYIILFGFFIFSISFESLQSRFTQMLRPQKGNSGVSFNDTLLNFGLWAQNLRQGIVIITSFELLEPGITNGVKQFCRYHYFWLWNIILFCFFISSNILESLTSKFKDPKKEDLEFRYTILSVIPFFFIHCTLYI